MTFVELSLLAEQQACAVASASRAGGVALKYQHERYTQAVQALLETVNRLAACHMPDEHFDGYDPTCPLCKK